MGNPTGTFQASDLELCAGFATRFGRVLLGLSGGMIQNTIAGDTENAFSGRVGGLLEMSQNFSVGLVAQNLGTELGQDPLPLILKAGLALKRGFFNLAADVGKPQDGDLGSSHQISLRLNW